MQLLPYNVTYTWHVRAHSSSYSYTPICMYLTRRTPPLTERTIAQPRKAAKWDTLYRSLQNTGATASAEYGRLAVWAHSSLFFRAGRRLYRSWVVHQRWCARFRFLFSLLFVTRILRLYSISSFFSEEVKSVRFLLFVFRLCFPSFRRALIARLEFRVLRALRGMLFDSRWTFAFAGAMAIRSQEILGLPWEVCWRIQHCRPGVILLIIPRSNFQPHSQGHPAESSSPCLRLGSKAWKQRPRNVGGVVVCLLAIYRGFTRVPAVCTVYGSPAAIFRCGCVRDRPPEEVHAELSCCLGFRASFRFSLTTSLVSVVGRRSWFWSE